MPNSPNNSEHPQAPLPSNNSITLHAVGQPTRKRRGEAAEAAFLARATHLGFTVLIPWGDSNRYDSVVELNHGLLRVRVKSATLNSQSDYFVRTTGGDRHVYTIADIDFFVGYVIPENIWYIIPVEVLGQRTGIAFHPHTRYPSKTLFEKYREAWCLLDCPRTGRGRNHIPMQCRSREVGTQCTVCPLRKNRHSICHPELSE